jgi:hypothetical protein
MEYIANNIQWDTEGEQVDLPTELTVEVPDNITKSIDVSEYISDEITNMTGFCHFGFTTILKN